MSISARHIGELTDAVASDEPVPGGGAVSGIAAALAAGLAAMAAQYALRHDPDSALFTHLTDRGGRAPALRDPRRPGPRRVP